MQLALNQLTNLHMLKYANQHIQNILTMTKLLLLSSFHQSKLVKQQSRLIKLVIRSQTFPGNLKKHSILNVVKINSPYFDPQFSILYGTS